MTSVCCTRCRLRFDRGHAAYIETCPECGKPPLRIELERSVGFRLYVSEDLLEPWPLALPVTLPLIWPDEL